VSYPAPGSQRFYGRAARVSTFWRLESRESKLRLELRN